MTVLPARELATWVAADFEARYGCLPDPEVLPPVWAVQMAICQRSGFTLAQLLSPRRHKPLAHARHVAVWLAWKVTAKSITELGRAFAHRDHTTIMHAISRINALMECDPGFAAEMRALQRALTAGDPT